MIGSKTHLAIMLAALIPGPIILLVVMCGCLSLRRYKKETKTIKARTEAMRAESQRLNGSESPQEEQQYGTASPASASSSERRVTGHANEGNLSPAGFRRITKLMACQLV